MNEIRIICADSPYGKGNCQYAKVVEERGEFPVIIEKLTTDADGKKGIIREERIETHRYAVYCTHPKQKNKFVGTVEPYGGVCYLPTDCPQIQKITIWQRIKSFLNM